MARRILQLEQAPAELKGTIDPKDYEVGVGDLVDVEVDAFVDFSGQRKRTRIRITKLDDRGGEIRVEGRSTVFARRFAFFAPNGTADYPGDMTYAHFSLNSGFMADETEGYLFF